MVNISISNSKINILCEAGVASKAILFFSDIDKDISDVNGRCLLLISLKDIEAVRKFTQKFKSEVSINIDNSVHEWVAKYEKNKPLLIRVGVTYSTIYRSSTSEIPHRAIDDVCKYFFKPAINMKSYKDSRWDGYYHLYDKRTRRFLTGLLPDVINELTKLNIGYVVEFLYEKAPERQFEWKAKNWFELSDDQKEAIAICKEKRRCVVKAATGFGKTSALARYLTAEFAVPTLFIANKKVLLDDAAKDFGTGIENLNMDEVAQIKDGKFGAVNLRGKFTEEDISHAFDGKKVIVATIQSLEARLKDKKTSLALIKWLGITCKFLMVDETQAIGTKIWDDVLKVINAPYRVFLSATPKRTDGATLKLFAYSGPLAFDTSAHEQIKKGRLCEMDIYYKPFDHKLYNENDRSLNYQETYAENIVNNEKRNSFIISEAIELLKEDRQVLILIQFIEHGFIIHSKLLEAGFSTDEVKFIYGETPDKTRQKVIDDFRKGTGKVLIGSTIADVGMNIPSISGVILCGAGNSEITHIQRIGRGSRIFDYKKNWGYLPKFMVGKEKVTKVVDILDNNIAFFKKQAKNRYYNACEEFGVDRVHLVDSNKSIFNTRKKTTNSYTSKLKEGDFVDEFKEFQNMKSELGYTDDSFSDFIDEFNE